MKYEKGKIIKGHVTGIENYGIFVGLDDYYSGLIHISEISECYIRNINDYVKVGETIKTKIVDIDEENYQMKLSIKNVDYKMNHRKKVKIVETPSGFTPLKDNLDGWIAKRLEEDEKNKNLKNNIDKQ